MTDLVDEDAGGPALPGDWGEPRHRTVAWHDPEVILAASAALSGLDYVRAIAAGRLPKPPIAELMQIRLLAVEHGEVRAALAPDESLMNATGRIHGGVLCALLDTVMGLAVQTTLDTGIRATTIELKVSFLRPMPMDGAEVTAVGKVLKPGRRVSFAEGYVHAADGKLIGQGTTSLATLDG